MHDPAEHGLVVKAICDSLGGCFEWDERAVRRILDDPDMRGLTPKYLRRKVIEFGTAQGGAVVKQNLETRDPWQADFKYYYKVILPESGFKHGVFVEMVLSDGDDPELPEVTLVGAHPQRK
jgi:hypothetical protein